LDANGHRDPVGAPVRSTARVLAAALAAILAGCTLHPRTTSRAAASSAAALVTTPACIVADTSARTRDTLYVVGVEPPGDNATSTDCERRATAAPPVIIAEMPAPGTDLRDVLDRGLPATHMPRPDVVVTRDPNVVSYAATSAGYFTVVLPYDRTYVLVSADSAPAIPSQTDRDALARDAVTGDARGATPPFAWLADPTCMAPFAPTAAPTAAPPKSVVAYVDGDAIARELAERVVALAASRIRPAWLPTILAPGAAPARVAPVTADSITGALATGLAAAAVIALPLDPRARCGTPGAPFPWRAVPLVDSRAHAIVRRGSGAAFIIRADGTLRFIRRSPR
jgi:hypothetical protein